MTGALAPEDYEEPCCVLKKPGAVTPIPMGRVIERLDAYLSRNDYSAAERHLSYWLAEADACGDLRGRLSVLNEQIGLYRKLNRKAEGLRAIEAALPLARELGLEQTVTMGTMLVNAATAYKAFGQAETALPLYRQAQAIYERLLEPDDGRLGGLYNNMALTVTALGQYPEAERLFDQALQIMAQIEHGELETAITCCNLADLTAQAQGEKGEAQLNMYLERAEALLNTQTLPRDGYYAFVCEKCAPTFDYYGFFLTGNELRKRAKEIYERI